jgi:hypothetical protein
MSGLYASIVVTWAKGQVGYKETGTNINKYAADMDKNYPNFFNTKKQGAEWCGVFVCDGFCVNYGESNALKMLHLPKKNLAAGCKYAANYYRAAKAWYTYPKVGDQIFFGTKGSEKHTGLVVEVSSTTVTTVEGNQSNAVKQCSYKLGSSSIAGYGRPAYDAEPAPTPTPTPGGKTVDITMNILKEGSKGEQVKTLQRILKELGYKDSKKKVLAIDGSFGPATLYAVKNFQKANKLTVDGCVGQATWNKLLKG